MSDVAGPHSDAVLTALEATCDALMTLESGRAEADERISDPARHHLGEAIALLRRAMEELRLARGRQESVVGRGFVVSQAPPVADRRSRPVPAQERPRRTA
jgi:hypothetical protein